MVFVGLIQSRNKSFYHRDTDAHKINGRIKPIIIEKNDFDFLLSGFIRVYGKISFPS